MALQPDEDHDVIIHQFRGRDGRDIWTIRLGDEKLGERITLESAIERPRLIARMHSRPAWIQDETGYPLKPIERDALH